MTTEQWLTLLAIPALLFSISAVLSWLVGGTQTQLMNRRHAKLRAELAAIPDED